MNIKSEHPGNSIVNDIGNPSTLPFMGGFFNVNMADFVLIM